MNGLGKTGNHMVEDGRVPADAPLCPECKGTDDNCETCHGETYEPPTKFEREMDKYDKLGDES